MPGHEFGRFMSVGHAKKLSEDDVREIKRMLAAQIPYVIIAEQFHITKSMVSKIRNGTRWPWVPTPTDEESK